MPYKEGSYFPESKHTTMHIEDANPHPAAGYITVADIPGGFTIPFVTPEADDQVRVRMPFAGTLTGWYLGGDDDIVIDVWKDTFANYPPTDADSVTNSNEPTLSSATTASATDLSGWTDATFDAGDWLVFNVDSVGDSITYADLAFTFEKD